MATRNSGPSGSRTRSTPSRSPCPRCSTAPRPTPSSTPARATTTTTPFPCSTTCRHSAIPACAGSAENASAEGKRRGYVGDSSSPRGSTLSRLRSRSRQQATPPHPRILSMSPHARPRHPRARPRGPRIEPVGAPGSRTTSLVREPRKGGHIHGRLSERPSTNRPRTDRHLPRSFEIAMARRLSQRPNPSSSADSCNGCCGLHRISGSATTGTASSDSGPDIRHRVDAGRSRYRAAQLQDRHRPPCLATAESVARGRAAPARGRLSCPAGQRAVVERADVNPILVYMVVPRVERDHRRSSALMADLVIVEPPRKDEQHHRGPRGRTAWSARRSGTRATCCRRSATAARRSEPCQPGA